MMKNMGNWSRLEKGNGMGLHQTADEDTEGEQETGSKTQVTGSRKLDTRHRTQGNITLASQTSDKDTQGTQETRNRIQDSGHMIQDTGHWTLDSGHRAVDTGHRARHLNGLGSLLQQIADEYVSGVGVVWRNSG